MRKTWVIAGALALGAAACEPEVQPVESPPPVAAFDPGAVPPVVPTPNDLAMDPVTGLVAVPVDPTASAAQQEFTRDYLNTLDGFPTSTVATTSITSLDPTTLKANTVVLLDLDPEAKLPEVTPELGYDAGRHLLTVTPPRSGWPKGGHYAVAVIGGDNGVKGPGGKPVVGSPAWGLLRFPTPLVECQQGVEPSPDTCRATTLLIPSTKTDLAERKKDQAATALRLEALRLMYAPVLERLEARGIHREDVAIAWTFRVMSLPEATFDPEHNVVPYPSDLLLDASGTHVALPVAPGTPPDQAQLIVGLNQLDGFSTSAPIISENGDTRGAIDVGTLDAALLPSAARFLRVTSTGTAVPQPNVDVCLNCMDSKKADGSTPSNPSQLQFVPRVPLDEKTTYAAVLTTGLRNGQGQRVVPTGAFALLRSSAPIADIAGHSLVSGVLDVQAMQLEEKRKSFKRVADVLVNSGIPRKDMLLAWSVTTQSTVSTLRKLHALPSEIGASDDRLPAAPHVMVDATSAIKATLSTAKLPSDNIGKVFQGELVVPFVLTGPGGVMNTGLRRFDRVPFLLFLPAAAAPSEQGYPVTIFGHGLKGNHQHVLPLANALAGTGRAVISVDTVKHGERSMCVGSAVLFWPKVPTPTDDLACANPTTQRCDTETASPTYGRCIARPGVTPNACNHLDPSADFACAATGQGRCLDNDLCEGGTFLKNSDGSVTISGWNMLDLQNFFVTRDNFRHQVIDLAQVARVLQGDGIDTQLAALGAAPLDGTRIDYVGQSLGGILGTLYTSVAPEVHRAVLNVPGGRLTQVLDEATASDFVNIKTQLYATLAAKQLPQGSPGFDTFVRTAQWVLDPGDPINYAWHVSNGVDVPADREALVQYILGDKVIPNSTTLGLLTAANGRGDGSRPLSTQEFNPSLTDLPGDSRHGFLTNNSNPAVTQDAQTKLVQFLTQ